LLLEGLGGGGGADHADAVDGAVFGGVKVTVEDEADAVGDAEEAEGVTVFLG
jgi:hypothetical protein